MGGGGDQRGLSSLKAPVWVSLHTQAHCPSRHG